MTMVETPQHVRALGRANEVRIARAELKRMVKAGEREARSVVLDPPWEARTMKVFDLLCAQRLWGPKRARALLARLVIPESRMLVALTDRQRRILADALL